MLDCIVMMDETMVSYHTPETKKQSKQWIPKGQPGPLKARVHASRTKQMVVAFFDSRGLIYTHIVPRGASINVTYTIKVLGKFLEHFKKKRPRHGPAAVVVPLGQSASPHGRQRDGVDSSERDPGPGTPALFARSGTGRLFPVQESEGGLGGHHVGPREPQERLGRGHQGHHRRRLRHGLPVVV
jgi:hypothetical protein